MHADTFKHTFNCVHNGLHTDTVQSEHVVIGPVARWDMNSNYVPKYTYSLFLDEAVIFYVVS